MNTFKLFFTSIWLLLGLFALFENTDSNFKSHTLTAKSSFAAESLIPKEVQNMPVWELLKTLGLDQFPKVDEGNIVLQKKLYSGAHLFRVSIKNLNQIKSVFPAKQGLGVLFHELSNFPHEATELDLLFNSKGHLIAIFPSMELVYKFFIPYQPWNYIDLSPYYLEYNVLNLDHFSDEYRRIKSFSNEFKENQALIEEFLMESLKIKNKKSLDDIVRKVGTKKTLVKELPPTYAYEEKRMFLYIEVEKDPSALEYGRRPIVIKEFLPEELSLIRLDRKKGKHQILIPVFPTVYTPAWHTQIDRKYWEALAYGKEAYFQLKDGDKALLIGPGSGMDTWLTWLTTQSTIHVSGINPLEVANTRVTAQLAGIPLESKVFNNVMNDQQQLVFHGQFFDVLIWNMPYYVKNLFPIHGRNNRLSRFWDKHFTHQDVDLFLEGLKQILRAQGTSLLWNNTHMVERINLKEFNVRSKLIARGTSLFLLRKNNLNSSL